MRINESINLLMAGKDPGWVIEQGLSKKAPVIHGFKLGQLVHLDSKHPSTSRNIRIYPPDTPGGAPNKYYRTVGIVVGHGSGDNEVEVAVGHYPRGNPTPSYIRKLTTDPDNKGWAAHFYGDPEDAKGSAASRRGSYQPNTYSFHKDALKAVGG